MRMQTLNLARPILMTFLFDDVEREEGIYQLRAYPRETSGRDERNEAACQALAPRLCGNSLDAIADRDADDRVQPFEVEMLFAYDITDALRVGCIGAADRARAFCEAKATDLAEQEARVAARQAAA